MATDIDYAALNEKTTIIAHFKNGDQTVVHSSEVLAALVHNMTGTLSGFIAFKDVRDSFIIINVSEVLSISLYSVERTKTDATS